MLTRLAHRQQPICICAGTNDGNIITVADATAIAPRMLYLPPLVEEEDYVRYWEEMTRVKNSKRPGIPDVSLKD